MSIKMDDLRLMRAPSVCSAPKARLELFIGDAESFISFSLG